MFQEIVMPQPGRTTLSTFLTDTLDAARPPSAALCTLLLDLAAAAREIAATLAAGALDGNHASAATLNVHAEEQKKLDLVANEIVLRHCVGSGSPAKGTLAAIVSEEMEQVYVVPRGEGDASGQYLLAFDPLDGSSNLDTNGSVGSIFSILRASATGVGGTGAKGKTGATGTTEATGTKGTAPEEPGCENFLRPGREQVAAAYALYGPSTMLVLSVGQGTHGFTLEPASGNSRASCDPRDPCDPRASSEFVLTHPDLRIPEDTSEFSINVSNERVWEAPVTRYVRECKAGQGGCRQRDFNMRWFGAMVAHVHRILLHGGIFMYPGSYPHGSRTPAVAGRLRLLYEANPMSMLVEQAGGLALARREALLDLLPQDAHQRVAVVLGSRHEVERIQRYYGEYDRGEDRPYTSPLFGKCSLFLPEAAA
jgi:fructose-1,6-bisphosphatase I